MISLIIVRTPAAQELCWVWLSSAHFLSPLLHEHVHSLRHTHTKTASTNHSRPAPSHAPERGFKSNFSWKIRCFSSIFEPFVQGLVLFTLPVHWYLHTSLKGKEKMASMIYGLQQKHNFPCCAPNLRGQRERSHRPYKYQGPSMERGRAYSIPLKKNVSGPFKVQDYRMHKASEFHIWLWGRCALSAPVSLLVKIIITRNTCVLDVYES